MKRGPSIVIEIVSPADYGNRRQTVKKKKEKTKEHEDSIFFFKKRPLTYSEWKLSSAEALKRVKPTMEAIVCWRSISGAANRRNPVKLGKSAENPVKLGRRMANSVQPSERGQRRAARRRRCVCFIRRRRRRRRFHFPRRFITEFRTGFWERRRRRRSMAATTRVATHRPRLSLKKKTNIFPKIFIAATHAIARRRVSLMTKSIATPPSKK